MTGFCATAINDPPTGSELCKITSQEYCNSDHEKSPVVIAPAKVEVQPINVEDQHHDRQADYT
jgi:hypothetical protein